MYGNQEEKKEMTKNELASWKTLTAGTVGKPTDKQVWTDIDEIIEVLDNIGKHQASNFTFLPSGGSNELAGAQSSHENGLMELFFDGSRRSPTLVKPTSLIFHAVGDNPEWWYFRLETARFPPSNVYGNQSSSHKLIPWSKNNEIKWSMQYIGEELVELTKGKYVKRYHWDIDQYGVDENGDELPLPKSARLITRKYNGGAYVIFPKFSFYNLSTNFDSEHNRVNDEQFREFIEKLVSELEKQK